MSADFDNRELPLSEYVYSQETRYSITMPRAAPVFMTPARFVNFLCVKC